MSEPILAKAFATSCCHDQSEFLNNAARELYGFCRGPSGFDGQLWEIAKFLNKDGQALINGLAKFIELKTKDLPT